MLLVASFISEWVVVRYNANARCSVSGHPAAVAVATKIVLSWIRAHSFPPTCLLC